MRLKSLNEYRFHVFQKLFAYKRSEFLSSFTPIAPLSKEPSHAQAFTPQRELYKARERYRYYVQLSYLLLYPPPSARFYPMPIYENIFLYISIVTTFVGNAWARNIIAILSSCKSGKKENGLDSSTFSGRSPNGLGKKT